MDHKVKLALTFAKWAHGLKDQRRKYTDEPYHVHPANVVCILQHYGASVRQQIAGALHDVLEDTAVSSEQIARWFGKETAFDVEQLTDVSKPEDGNRAIRKQMDFEHAKLLTPENQTVKIADLIDNTASILQHDKKFAKIYFPEKKRLLGILTKGDYGMWLYASAITEQALIESEENEICR